MKPVRRVVLLAIAMVTALIPATPAAVAAGPAVFVNEIHYDNTGTDAGEAIEIAGPAGTDLTGWSIVLYNGSNGASYNTTGLSGTLPDQQSGFGTTVVTYSTNGIQNGSPDGIALVDVSNSVVQFLSYEGSFTATDGPANGMTSVDIGVSEPNSTAVGDSLQLIGIGTEGGDFTWAAAQPNTFGTVNAGQTFGTAPAAELVINEFVANHTGADTEAFIEVLGSPSTDYSAYTVLEIEGDGSGAGVIDAILPVTSTSPDGYWIDDEDMENGTITILLVEDFTGTSGQDLDEDNDGAFDVTPWDRVVDDVAVTDGGSSDVFYSATVLSPFYDGQPFTPGGASRIPNGTDTDTTADWVRNDFDGFGFPGFVGTQAIGEAVNTPGATNVVITVIVDLEGVCGDPATFIHDIQGSGLVSGDIGNIREIEGVVVGDHQDDVGENGDLNGFFVQEEDDDADTDLATSEGIFVFQGSNPDIDVFNGDVVRVRGTVTEFFGQTQLSSVESILDCGTGTATPATVTFPLASIDDLEAYEGMSATFPQTLSIIEYFNFDRFGETVVGFPLEGEDRHYQPTAIYEPGSVEAADLASYNARSRITIDDGRTSQNPDPAIHPGNGEIFDLSNRFRGGDTIEGITGPIYYTFGLYRIMPTEYGEYVAANPRDLEPENVGGDLKIATLNALNYFSTLDLLDENGDSINADCGPNKDEFCRGANTAEERERQLTKLTEALVGMDADIVGLIELENTAGVEPLEDIVDALNDRLGKDTYRYVKAGKNSVVGTDVIKVGIIYKKATVVPNAEPAILDDPSFLDPRNLGDDKNRAALAQTFNQKGTGEKVTVVVNHLKSKGSGCGEGDDDPEQGSCNLTRTLAAQALLDWIDTDPTHMNDPDFLIIGDLNSYDKEDPIDVLRAGGYADLLADYQGERAYSYVFSGQFGYLDYGMSSRTLTPQVTGATAWHINSDEPDILDYDTTFKKDAQDALFEENAFRSSDHDAVIIGLDLDRKLGG